MKVKAHALNGVSRGYLIYKLQRDAQRRAYEAAVRRAIDSVNIKDRRK